MPRCLYCHRDLPGFDNICAKCFAARSADIERPKSILEIVTNPLGLTAEELRLVKETPRSPGRQILIFLGAFAFFFLFGLLRTHLHTYHPLTPKTCALIALPLAVIAVYVENRSRR